MAKFVPGRALSTAEPTVVVDGGIALGTHVFELIVEDDAGNVSGPARAVVKVTEGRVQPPGNGGDRIPPGGGGRIPGDGGVHLPVGGGPRIPGRPAVPFGPAQPPG